MQQRQPRLGDILDDYCPRERRLTNHAIVAMIGDAVKRTRCATCEAEHEYKHARLPRPRRQSEHSSLYSQVLAGVTPKKAAPPTTSADDVADSDADDADQSEDATEAGAAAADLPVASPAELEGLFDVPDAALDDEQPPSVEEGPAHRRLIRAQLPRHEGQVSTTRQAPDFTIRQPATGRPNHFRSRHQRAGGQVPGNRGGSGGNGGNGNVRGGAPRHGGRPQSGGRPGNHQGPGRNRSK